MGGGLPKTGKRVAVIVISVIGAIFLYNFVKSRFADDKLPELVDLGKKS